MKLESLAEKLLIALLLALAASFKADLGKLTDNVEQMTKSVIQLNARLEVFANDLGLIKTTLSDHEERIRGQERRREERR